MPDTDRRTLRRPARPRKTTTRESETTMRELFAFIKAAADLGLYKLKVRIDDLFTDYRDPFDVELPELVQDGESARDVAGVDPTEVTGDPVEAFLNRVDPTEVTGEQVEAFLNRVAAVTSTIEVHPSMVHAYLRSAYGFVLLPWQRDLLAAYYGPQIGAAVWHRRPTIGGDL